VSREFSLNQMVESGFAMKFRDSTVHLAVGIFDFVMGQVEFPKKRIDSVAFVSLYLAGKIVNLILQLNLMN
jgi:hypothetical protein